MAWALNRLRTRAWYLRVRESPLVGRGLRWLRTLLKRLYLPTIFFEELGFRYFGVVDGHDIGKLIEAIDMVKDIQQPVVLQVVTVKGKGYELAERQPSQFHGVAPFLIENGLSKQEKCHADLLRRIWRDAHTAGGDGSPHRRHNGCDDGWHGSGRVCQALSRSLL